ncbi:hypothetical protein DFH06DRAFT_520939 [Mycena polygramma]|nr:hypothetical protein DFH06DRAFT_520939 [Mycena polygramma]
MVLSCPSCNAPFIVPPVSRRLATTNPTPAYLFTSNDVPLDSEMASICQLVSDGAHMLGVLDGQISALEDLLAQVVHKREEVVEQVRRNQAMISPVRRIPQELICEVFGWVALSDDDAEEDANGLNAPPWYLGHICQSWRASALSCPRLWTSVTIPRSPPSPRDRLLVETQILHSAHASLKVHWFASAHGDVPDPRVVELILAQCHRWKTLSLNLHGKRVELNWLRPLDGRLHSLEKLVILNSPRDSVIPNIFATALSLRRAILINSNFEYSSPDVPVPWGQITHYRGSYETSKQLTILQAAPNLIQSGVSFRSGPALPPATLPHLRRLWIEDLKSLSSVIAPSLQDLFCLDSSPRDTSAVLPFVEASSCRLTKLVLMSCVVCRELVILLHGLPYLTYLLIEACHENPDDAETALFDAMSVSDDSSVLCPNLTFLAYGFGYGFEQDCFLAMVKSRFHCPTPCLKTLRLFNAYEDTEEYTRGMDPASGIQKLREEGFDAAFLDGFQLSALQKRGFFPDLSFDGVDVDYCP